MPPATPDQPITRVGSAQPHLPQQRQRVEPPGYQTTEFWQSLAVTFVGLFLIVYGVLKPNDTALTWGVSLTGASSVGYAATRAIVKRKG